MRYRTIACIMNPFGMSSCPSIVESVRIFPENNIVILSDLTLYSSSNLFLTMITVSVDDIVNLISLD